MKSPSNVFYPTCRESTLKLFLSYLTTTSGENLRRHRRLKPPPNHQRLNRNPTLFHSPIMTLAPISHGSFSYFRISTLGAKNPKFKGNKIQQESRGICVHPSIDSKSCKKMLKDCDMKAS
ncbi:unnamed protein product [Vicia faba]|uniref:Uncharacterized protein n=1 Tax=Vicia faba TaxID=3906 RepID=A0AAV0YPR5_VICFA|nr:unnamed protein product [Vicia faba]